MRKGFFEFNEEHDARPTGELCHYYVGAEADLAHVVAQGNPVQDATQRLAIGLPPGGALVQQKPEGKPSLTSPAADEAPPQGGATTTAEQIEVCVENETDSIQTRKHNNLSQHETERIMGGDIQ